MTSKISFFKLVKDDIRQRMRLMAFTSVLFLCIYPVYGAMELENRLASLGAEGAYGVESLKKWVEEFAGSGNFFFAGAASFIAVVSAFSAFAYLHSKDKVDFYHSFPVTRGALYAKAYVSSFFMFVVPFVVSYAMFIAIAAQKSVLPSDVFDMVIRTIAVQVIYFLLIYSVTVVSVMLTGKIIMGVLAAIVFMSYVPVLFFVIDELCSFFVTYTPSVHTGNHLFFSPLGNYFEFVGNCQSGLFSWTRLLLVLLLAVIMIGVGYLLYRFRPLEAAESTLAFQKTGSFIKVLLSVPLSLAVASVMTSSSVHPIKWMAVISVLGTLLLCLTIEFMYHMDIKKIVCGKIGTAVAVFGVMVILFAFYKDIFGYDSYLPKKDKVSQMALLVEEDNGFFVRNADRKYLQANMTDAFGPIYALAEEGAKNTEKALDKEQYFEGKLKEKLRCIIAYKEKKDTTKYRTYYVSRETVKKTVVQMCKNEEYKEKMFGVEKIEPGRESEFYINDILENYGNMDITQEQKKSILGAYKKDFKDISVEQMMEENPIARLEIVDDSFETYMLPVYKENERTLESLKAAGYEIQTSVLQEDVKEMEVIVYDEDTDKPGNRESVTDVEKQQKILELLSYQSDPLFAEHDFNDMEIMVTLKDNRELYFSCNKEKIANILK